MVISYCRGLKDMFGWERFSFVDHKGVKGWGFNDNSYIHLIRAQFPETELTEEVIAIVEREQQIYTLREKREEKAVEIKKQTTTDFVIKGIKGTPYQYQNIGVEFFVNANGRALNADEPGCISGDAKIIVNRGGNARQYTFRELFHKFNGGVSKGGKIWDTSIPSEVMALQPNGEFRLTPIKRVMSSGVKKVITLKAATSLSEYYLDLTPDHRVKTPKGWTEAGSLKKGDSIIVNGVRWCETCQDNTECADSEYIKKNNPFNYGACKKCIYRFSRNNRWTGYAGTLNGKGGYLVVTGLYFHPIPKGDKLKHILVYEAAQNKVTYEEWCDMCRFNKVPKKAFYVDTSKFVIHHKNGNKLDNSIFNLELLTSSAHAKAHAPENIKKLWNVNSQIATITDVIDKGELIDTYDIEMTGSEPNFIANGIVVHNCGKTIQAIGYAQHTEQPRVLVVCPASVKFSWEMEITKWTDEKSYVIDSKTDFSKLPKDRRYYIINYDILIKHLSALSSYGFTLVIFDEAHMIKNAKAKRTKAANHLCIYIEKVILLTGTPVLSRPEEMYNLLCILDPQTWANQWTKFARRYCGAKENPWGLDTRGASNITELHDKIKNYFIRRLKTEVLPELPPKVRSSIPVELEPKLQREYWQIENEIAMNERDRIMGMDDSSTAQADQLVRLGKLRQLCAMGKLPAAKELITSIIESGQKVVVLGSYVAPLQSLYEDFKDQAVMLTGDTKMEERGQFVYEFQNNPNVKVFFGGIKSAGVGITLTASSNVVFLDYAWNPADHIQGENRCHRVGSVGDSVNVMQLHARGTIDERLKSILESKQAVLDALIDGIASDESDSVIKQVMDDIMSRHG